MNGIADPKSQSQEAGLPKKRGAVFVVFLGLMLLVVANSLMGSAGSIIDVDDRLRALQITQFFQHADWYDLRIRGVEMPEAYVSPWSRLVDLPYIAITFALQPLMGQGLALDIAFHVWPLVMLCLVCVLWLGTLRRLDVEGGVDRYIPIIAAFMLLMQTVQEFTPGRIDHHNVQMLLLIAALFGVSMKSQGGMVLSATACVFSLLVGLELAPVVLLIVLAPCLAWAFDFEGSRRRLVAFSTTVATVAPLAGIVFVGMERLSGTECDAFSAPYLALIVSCGCISAAAALFIRQTSPLLRLAALAAPAMVLVLYVAYRHPACLGGPYPMVDNVIWDVWISQIPQEQSVLQYFAKRDWPSIFLLATYVPILAASATLAFNRLRAGDMAFPTVYAVAIYLFALYLLQLRFSRFPPLIIALLLPFVWERFRSGVKVDLPVVTFAALICIFAAAGLAYAIPFRPLVPTLAHYMAFDKCARNVSVLEELEPGRILLAPSLGLTLLDKLPQGFSVGALAFHRGGPGMRRFYDVSLSEHGHERMKAAAPFRYLALCRPPAALQLPVDSLLAALQRDASWSGLIPILKDRETGFSLFRIDHAHLR